MAQKVGLHWPTPPPISVRNLVKLAGGQLSPLNWLPANPFSILIDQGQDAWHAGHVNDVLALDTGAIVLGTDSGGVWLVEGNDSAIPLSDGWDTPNISCLAFGPDGPLHIFAGGDALFETDTSTPFPLLNWRQVPLTAVSPAGATVGTIIRMVVLKQRRRIVLACENGVFWSSIPTSGNAYNWQQVPNLPQGGYSGLAIGPNDRIVIAAWGSDPNNPLHGTFYADWSAGGLLPFGSLLHLARALGSNTVSGMVQKVGLKWPPPPPISVRNLLGRAALPPSQAGQNPIFGWGMGRTSLASSAQDPRVMYAVSAQAPSAAPPQPDFTIYAVLASSDGGATWTQVTIPNFPGIPFHQGDYNNCLAVSPFDPNVVVLGWLKHFVSRDSGKNWQLFDEHAGLPGLHDDVHAVYFDPAASPPNERLYVCSDGGVAMTEDRGRTFVSHMNKHLLNLQFYGAKFSASHQTPGLIAGATQDNGNMYSTVGANMATWTWMEGGDGGLMMFVGTGELLHYYSQQPDGMLLHVAQWDGTRFNDVGQVSSNGLPDIPFAPVCAIVNAPLKRNTAGQLMWAIAAGDPMGTGVYGIFSNNQGPGMHYELLGRIPLGLGLGPITALGSADGRIVFVGTTGGLIYAINTDQQITQQLTVVPLRDSSEGDPGASIDRIVVLSNNLAFAILSNSQYDAARKNFILRWNGASWNAVGVGEGLPGDQFAALESTNPKPLFALFAATDKQVFESDDNGDTWQPQSVGLPTRPHCTDLRFVTEPAGARFLYLSTYGRSIWRASLDAPM